jgi:cyclopropane fatty-acyl-phospholipid synthase-like methyltransferase
MDTLNVFSPSEKNIFQMMTGFFTSKLLAVGVELDLFTWLSTQPRTFTEIQEHFRFAARPCRIFLDTLVSVNLLNCENGVYRNASLAEMLLVRGRPDFQGPHVQLFDHLYLACDNLKAALSENRPMSQDYSYFFEEDQKEVARYSGLMHESSVVPAMVLPQYWDFSDSRRVLDIGGGYGRLCLTLASQFPELELTLYDLPEVCKKAESFLQTYPDYLTSRIDLQPGNFFQDQLPSGADTIVMMRILHDWPREQVKMLVAKAFAALPSGGRLLIYETFKDEGPSPGDAAFISLLLLLISPGGECRTVEEMNALLREVGFASVEVIPTVYFYNLLVATKA